MKTKLAPLAVAVLSLAACSSRRAVVFGHLSGGEDVERIETYDLSLLPGERLELATPHGEVVVRSEPGAAPRLIATLRASGRTREEAERVLARYAISIDDDRAGVKVGVDGEPARVRGDGARLSLGAVVNFAVTVPEDVVLRVDSRSGDIGASGSLGACRLDTKYGTIDLEGANGDVAVHSDSGSLSVRDVRGGRVVVDSGYGSLLLERVTASSVRATSKSGDVTLVNGEAATIELDTNYGAVVVRGAEGAVRASSRSGIVELQGVNGAATAKSQYGRVSVEGVLTALEAKSSSGDVTVHARPGSDHATDWELSSGYGAVNLFVPADFGCVLAAHTRYGEVECAFPITLDSGKRRNGALKGVVGRGGRTVTLSSGSGDVALKSISSTAAVAPTVFVR